MDFYMLGPLEARQGESVVNLGGLRQQRVLAMLLLQAGKVVPMDRLIDGVWDDNPPNTARDQIQICVSNLRRIIIPSHGGDMIVTRRPGYLLHLHGCTLDMQLFDTQVEEGRKALACGDVITGAATLRQALSLWRGAALSSIPGTVIQQNAARLRERQLSVLEECIEAELTARVDQDLVSELVALIQEHPLRERFRGLLMIALYRAGRQADALEAYRHARDVLMEELGIEPIPGLQQLHRAILNGESLDDPLDRPQVKMATDEAPPVTLAPRIPMLLPASIPDLTGRTTLIDQVLAQTQDLPDEDGTVPVTIFYGQGGAGKPNPEN